MPKETMHSVLKQVGEAKARKDKIAILHKYSSPALKAVLGYTFDPTVKWLLPDGVPPYKEADAIDGENVFYSSIRKLYLFVDGPTDAQKNLNQVKRETIFIEMLESLHPDDAKVLIAMKDRKLPYNGLTIKLVKEAFPKLAENWN